MTLVYTVITCVRRMQLPVQLRNRSHLHDTNISLISWGCWWNHPLSTTVTKYTYLRKRPAVSRMHHVRCRKTHVEL